MLTDNTGASTSANLILRITADSVKVGDFTYTDGIVRSDFCQTSFQCKGRSFTVQGSNMPRPSETDDADWVDITAAVDNYADVPHLFYWMRLKGDFQPGDKVYALSRLALRR